MTSQEKQNFLWLPLDNGHFITGAGASKAACPIDKNGKAVPVLRNVHEVLGLKNTEKENSKEYIRLLERIGGGEQHGICFTDGQPDKVL